MANGVEALTEKSFDEVIASSDRPVLVDFWAEWCGPCKQIAPILDELAGEEAERLTVAKLDVDAHPGIAQRFNVMSIPTLILFKDGEQAARMMGARGKASLLQEIDPHL